MVCEPSHKSVSMAQAHPEFTRLYIVLMNAICLSTCNANDDSRLHAPLRVTFASNDSSSRKGSIVMFSIHPTHPRDAKRKKCLWQQKRDGEREPTATKRKNKQTNAARAVLRFSFRNLSVPRDIYTLDPPTQ
jgi:hypothetical protein